ncbi:MAG TPA: hypothetical protein VF257_02660 [Solirubrobacteraceae bacterium]
MLVFGLAPMAHAHGDEGDPGDVTHRDTPAELAGAQINRALARGSLTSRSAAALPENLPTTWCGTRRETDDVAHAAFPASSAQIKVVYAYASDQADDSALWADSLQGNVSNIERYLALQSGGRRALRFDMGTDCGPQYVDIQVVPLPSTRAYYLDDFDRVRDDVAAALSPASGPRDVFVLADGLSSGGVYGIGEIYPTADQGGSANVHNAGGLTGVMFVTPSTTPNSSGWQPTVMLHEISHNLGAVQATAPHSTSFSHCTDGEDVMCYADGSPEAQFYDDTVCPYASGAIPQTYDCGHDDYYNPAPAPGSYLATHWNVYNSDFMASCTQLQTACGADVVPTPPVNQGAPAVSGTLQRGSVLAASVGSWLNSPSSYAVQWQRGSGAAWTDLPGATSAMYVPTSADVGGSLRVMVTAANGDGAAVAASAPTAPVADIPGVAAAKPRSQRVQIRLRDRARRTAGTLTAKVRAVLGGREVSTAATRVSLRAGTWRLRLCAGPSRRSMSCVLSSRVRARSRRVRLPAARLVVITQRRITVTAAVVDGHARVRARGQAASV